MDSLNADDVPLDELTTNHFDPSGSATVTDAWEGVFLSTSWGYGQTNVDLARIVEVSRSGKTVVCQLAKATVTDRSRGSESVAPVPDCYGDPFRLHVRESGGEPWFRGSYPYCTGDRDDGTRTGSFSPLGPDESVHQTPHTHRH